MRSLTGGVVTEIDEPLVRPVFFAEIVYESSTLRLWTGYGLKNWDGHPWDGAGHLAGISNVVETTEMRAEGITLSLSGIPSGYIASALGDSRQGLPVKVWFGLLDATGAVIADPYNSFSGRLDVPSIEDTGITATITLQCESRLVELRKKSTRRYTDSDQQEEYPGDLGMQYVASMSADGTLGITFGGAGPLGDSMQPAWSEFQVSDDYVG